MIKRLNKWRRQHLAPGAPWFLACAVGSSLAFLADYFHIPIPYLMQFGWLCIALPLVFGFLAVLIVPHDNKGEYFGCFNSYHLTDQELFYKLCRVIPIFRVSLKEIQSIGRWLDDESSGDFDPSESRSFGFIFSTIWYWPAPIGYSLKKMTSLYAEKPRYNLRCESGWTIVLLCSNEFINTINRQVQACESEGKTNVPSDPSDLI